MATKAIETAGSLDQATLDALREGITAVLAEQSSSTAVHAFIDGRSCTPRLDGRPRPDRTFPHEMSRQQHWQIPQLRTHRNRKFRAATLSLMQPRSFQYGPLRGSA